MQQEIERQKKELIDEMAKIKSGKADLSAFSQQHMEKRRQQRSEMEKSRKHKSEMQRSQSAMQQSKKYLNPQDQETLQKKMDDLKIKQNYEMLQLLEEEQEQEAKREDLYLAVEDPEEQKRLKKILGLERAQAQLKLQHLSDTHDKQISELSEKFR